MLPRANHPVPGAELGRRERLEKAGESAYYPQIDGGNLNATVGAAQEPASAPSIASTGIEFVGGLLTMFTRGPMRMKLRQGE
jgi:hypothetical protein